jgi:fatty-acyl-CoA synthase
MTAHDVVSSTGFVMLTAMSYLRGTSEEPLLYQTVGGLLVVAAARWPDHEALAVRHQSARLTHRALDAQLDGLARGLLACGLKLGDRVGIWSLNNA